MKTRGKAKGEKDAADVLCFCDSNRITLKWTEMLKLAGGSDERRENNIKYLKY